MSESDEQSFISTDTESVFEDSRRDFLNLQNVENENQDYENQENENQENENQENENNENEVTEEDKASTLNEEEILKVLPMSQLENSIEKIIDKRLGHLFENQTISKKRKAESTSDKSAKKKRIVPEIIYETISSSSSSSDSVSDTEDEEDIFVDEKEVFGKKIKESSAKFLSERIKRKLKKECFSKILRKYKAPKNAKFLRAQRTNKEIWSKLRHASKTNDNFLTQIQNNVSKASIAIVKACEAKENCVRKKTYLTDSLTILSQSHLQIAALRRELQRSSITYPLKKACYVEEEDDELLYGKELPKKIKEAKESQQEYIQSQQKRSTFLGQRPQGQYKGQYNQNQTFQRRQVYPPKKKIFVNKFKQQGKR